MENLLLNTAYFPPVAYFMAIKQSRHIIIEQFENFGKQSYRNRCEIMTANGTISLTVPVVKANINKRFENYVCYSLAKITSPEYRISIQKFTIL